MTNEIENTRLNMYDMLGVIKTQTAHKKSMEVFESELESHLEALRQERGRLVEERDALRNRVQVLESANKIAGERLQLISESRETLSAISAHETPQNASCATLDANTAAILGALVDAQRIMTDYLVPDGIRAKDAIGKLIPVLDNEKLCAAMDAFETPKQRELEELACAIWADGYFVQSIAEKLSKGCQHEFHPKFPAGEMCTYCGVAK